MDREQAKKIIQMREGSRVTRCHTLPHHGSYDIAQHSFNMLLLLDELHPEPSVHLYRAILRHDLLERWTGDNPTAIKLVNPGFKDAMNKAELVIEKRTGIEIPKLTGLDQAWMKALDSIEFLMWCDDQIGMGNMNCGIKATEVNCYLHSTVWDSVPKELQEFLKAYKWERTPDFLGGEEEIKAVASRLFEGTDEETSNE